MTLAYFDYALWTRLKGYCIVCIAFDLLNNNNNKMFFFFFFFLCSDFVTMLIIINIYVPVEHAEPILQIYTHQLIMFGYNETIDKLTKLLKYSEIIKKRKE